MDATTDSYSFLYGGLSTSTFSFLVTLTITLLVVTCVVKFLTSKSSTEKTGPLPPHIPSYIPFLGHALTFSERPIDFLLAAYEKYGPVFSFTVVGNTFTYLIGSDAAAHFFNSKNENLNAEEAYRKLTAPIFGKGVVYDVPHTIFLEQKKMLKGGLNIAHFRVYVPLIEEETINYFKRWGNEGKADLFVAMSELIILTASRCLHGPELRNMMDKKVAQLYSDMDGGFTPMAWLLPSWLPLPSFRKRDSAHVKVKRMFDEAIVKRQTAGGEHDDLLQNLLDSTYKTGKSLTNDEIAGLLIAILLAGQHTSSTTSSWLGFFLAQDKDVQEQCYNEQVGVFRENAHGLDYDSLQDMFLLERCLKESLRMRPPIMTLMRICKTPLEVNGYVIPVGHKVCVSPTTNQRLPDTWKDCSTWDPDRFLEDSGAVSSEKFSYVPFGAGRHRCAGDKFAHVQIKTIWSTMLRLFQFDLVDGHFPKVNFQMMINIPLDPIIAYRRRVKVK